MRLHFVAEAFGARAAVHIGQIRVLVRSVAIAHAVEARQVGQGSAGAMT